jgi:hypothetical protein
MTDTALFLPRRLDAEELASYEKQGCLLLGRVLTDAGIERMRDEAMHAWGSSHAGFDEGETWLKNMLLPNAHHVCPTIRRFYFDGPLVDIAEQLVGPNVKGATSQLTFKLRGNTKPVGWHQDNEYGELEPYDVLTCLTALDDADEENGCLWVIPGSHRQGQIDVGSLGEPEARQAMQEIALEVDESGAIPAPLRAGEALIFHGWTLHKSDGNFSQRDRRILFLRYADADAVEVKNGRAPRLGKLVRGTTRFPEVAAFEQELVSIDRQ